MIITVTPNPALDQTMLVEEFTPGVVNRAGETHLDPAGKGINASRIAHRLGWPTIAFGFLSGETGRIVEDALDREGVQHHFVRVPGRTRVNVTVVAEDSDATSVYGPGPEVETEALGALTDLLDFWLQAGRVLVLAGSLPPGVPTDWYGDRIRRASERAVTTILDAHGEALRAGLDAHPDLIKPNVAEAEELLNRPLHDRAAILEAARELGSRTNGTVVVSMGAQGAVCVRRDEAWEITPPRVEPRSTVGSGDSFVAGLAVALARGDEMEAGLRLGTAAGAATAASSGTSLGTAEAVTELLPVVRVVRL